MSDVVRSRLVVVEGLHSPLAVIAREVLQTSLGRVVVAVALYLRGEDIPPSVVAAPVVAVHLELDVGLAGGPRAHGPHVEVDVLAGVVATQVGRLLPGGGACRVDEAHVVRGGARVRTLDVVTDGGTQHEVQEVQPHLAHPAAHLGEGEGARGVAGHGVLVWPARTLQVGEVGADGSSTGPEGV